MKQYSTPYGRVDLETDTRHMVVRLSGGYDSALMTTLLAQSAEPGTIIHPVTVIRGQIEDAPELDRIDITPVANNVVQFVRDIAEPRGVEVRDTQFATAMKWNNTNSYADTQKLLISQVVETFGDEDERKLRYVQYNGVTLNPPVQIAPDQMHNGREIHRDQATYVDDGDVLSTPGVATIMRNCHLRSNRICEPFGNADKRITIWLGEHIGMLDELLAVSRSCEGDRESTNNWTEECMTECWWCRERYWALGHYKDTE